MTTYSTETQASTTNTLETQSIGERTITTGMPIGLLLALTYASNFLVSLHSIESIGTTSYNLETQS